MTDGWWGTDGQWHAVAPETRAALQRSFGAADHPDGPPGGPATWFVRRGERPGLWSPGQVVLEDGGVVDVLDHLPPDLPFGSHRLVSEGGHVTHLFVVPDTIAGLARGWGWAVQLHAARSQASWGIGDLADLAALGAWSDRLGASVLAHSPLGATTPVVPLQFSPYYASSRRFISPLYLRVEDVAGAEQAADAVAGAAAAGRDLLRSTWIDRDAVWKLKLTALEAIWGVVRAGPSTRRLLDDATRDRALVDHARFCLLAELHRSGRSGFPASHAHPDRPEVAAAATEHADRVDFWCWVHLEAEQQLARAARAGVPMMADLPVGFDPDGSDAWADQDLLAEGCRVGAPPDEFNRAGQDWGLPPYVPWRLRAAGYAPWTDTLRRVVRHAGALRIDHVMGLFRLYCIPPGFPADRGGYVRQFGAELLELACMEAARAGVALVGEDLGTVEPEVREELSRRGVYGYRVGWFSDEAPASWPSRTVAMMSTHDLPTVSGLWTGADAADRERAGIPPDPDGDRTLRERLVRLVEAGGGTGGRDDARAVVLAAHRALAESGSDAVLATLEDALGVEHRPNLPGTVDEHPNWRVALPVPLERFDTAGAGELAAELSRRRPRSGPWGAAGA